jgi:Fe-S cluster assembly iron-binding protein IscA
MLTVTERTAQELKDILDAHATKPEEAIRLMAGPEGFSLRLDTEMEGDEVVESEGTKVLLVDAQLSQIVAGATLDCVDTPEGPRLRITKGEEPI